MDAPTMFVIVSAAVVVPSTPMMVIIVMVMAVPMMTVPLVQRAFPAIGAAFRFERPHDVMNMTTKTDHHIRQDMIGLNVDSVRRDLRWRVPIADMPGDACQGGGIVNMDFEQGLSGRQHLDQRSVRQSERVPMRQIRRLRQVEKKLPAMIRAQRDSPLEAICSRQRDRIAGRLVPTLSFSNDGCGARHDRSRCRN
jgi:hypothetical protein